MDLLVNVFKLTINSEKPQLGHWLGLPIRQAQKFVQAVRYPLQDICDVGVDTTLLADTTKPLTTQFIPDGDNKA